jgi:hypothetical protein
MSVSVGGGGTRSFQFYKNKGQCLKIRKEARN